MPPTLASLVQHSALKLTVRAGADRLDAPVRWAHASELADPVPYMEGGELLLVTATNLDAENPEAMRRYVRRLAGAGVVGLGFAVGVTYDDVPQPLVDAAEEAGLPCSKCRAAPRSSPSPKPSPRRSPPISTGPSPRDSRRSGNSPERPLPGTVPPNSSPGSPHTSTAGPRCTTPPGPSWPPPPTGRPAAPPGSPATWNACGNARRRPASSSATPTTGSSSSPWAPDGGCAGRWPWAPGRHSAPRSATRCTRRSPCSPSPRRAPARSRAPNSGSVRQCCACSWPASPTTRAVSPGICTAGCSTRPSGCSSPRQANRRPRRSWPRPWRLPPPGPVRRC